MGLKYIKINENKEGKSLSFSFFFLLRANPINFFHLQLRMATGWGMVDWPTFSSLGTILIILTIIIIIIL